MKKLTIIFCLFLCTYAALAQKRKVEYNKKTNAILVNGEQWASISKMKAGSSYLEMFILKDMQGKEIAYAKTFAEVGATQYEIQFVSSMQTIRKDFDMFSSTPRDFANFLIENQVLTQQGYNADGEKRTLAAFGQTSTNLPNTNPSANQALILERNRNADILVLGDKIQQDFKDIGTISQSNQSVQGRVLTTYKVVNHQNQLIAEVTTELNGKNISLVTIKDNQKFQLYSEDFSYNAIKKVIAKHLIDRYYW
jgi:hypothetical protein